MTPDRIPLILFGDGPRLSTGLARIARDLAMRLVAEQDALGIRFAQVGVDYPGGWQWQSWDFCGFQPCPEDQGRGPIASVTQELQRETGRRPVVLMIMDPARCYDLTRRDPDIHIDASFWGYFPLDAQNRLGTVGGPAARCIAATDRVLGYGRWGATMLQATLRQEQPRYKHVQAAPVNPVSYLPHGIETRVFTPGVPLEESDLDFREWARAQPAQTIKVGCVATNQPRKDLGLYFSTIAELVSAGLSVAAWLHTDKLTAAWDVGELVKTCGLRKEQVAVSNHEVSDRQLAARYGWSDVTIAPGLGEGYGYPIVESLSCGTPVVHGEYAGGVELISNPAWIVPAEAWRLESVYALLRPVFHPKTFSAHVQDAVRAVREHPAAMRAYCSGSVAHLDWEHLWPRWRAWITQGLREERGADHGQR